MSSVGMLALTCCVGHPLHARAFSSEPDNNQAEESNNDDEHEVAIAMHRDTEGVQDSSRQPNRDSAALSTLQFSESGGVASITNYELRITGRHRGGCLAGPAPKPTVIRNS